MASLPVAGPYLIRVSAAAGVGKYSLTVKSFAVPAAIVVPGGSLAAGLAQAAPGDTVLVLGGSYDEQVELAAGVALIGAGAASTAITGGVTAQGTDGALLRGFSLSRADDTSLSLENASVEIEDCFIVDGGASGAFVFGGGESVLRRNRILANSAKST